MTVKLALLLIMGGAEPAERALGPFAPNPPFAAIMEFSSAKTCIISSCAAEGRAVMNVGGAVGTASASTSKRPVKYASTVDKSAGSVSTGARSAITVGSPKTDVRRLLSLLPSLRKHLLVELRLQDHHLPTFGLGLLEI